MDVKFCEDQCFYSKSPIQGENQGNEWIICSDFESGFDISNYGEPQTAPESTNFLTPAPVFPCSKPVSEHTEHCIQMHESDTDPVNTNSDPLDHTSCESGNSKPIDTDLEPADLVETGTRNEKRELKTYSGRNKGANKRGNGSSVNPIQLQIQESTTETNPEKAEIDLPIALRKGKRACTEHPISKYVSYEKLAPDLKAFISNVEKESVPESFQEAVGDPRWRQAIDKELRALEKNQTWEITQLPKGKTPVGCKWVFTITYNPDGMVDRYKARLVTKGYTQTYGIDYQETFALVAKFNTIKMLVSCSK